MHIYTHMSMMISSGTHAQYVCVCVCVCTYYVDTRVCVSVSVCLSLCRCRCLYVCVCIEHWRIKGPAGPCGRIRAVRGTQCTGMPVVVGLFYFNTTSLLLLY
jgi:hypothetical protein